MKSGVRAAVMVLGVLAFAQAHAADLDARVQPAPVSAAYNWSGFYAGLNAGGAWGQSNMSKTTIYDPATGADYFVTPAATANINAVGTQQANARSAFTGGGQIGFNWQTGSVVLGVEADFQSFKQRAQSSASGHDVNNGAFTISHSLSTDWLWTLRPRAGFAIDNWLFYATGGVAVANVKANAMYVDFWHDNEVSSVSKTQVGWTAGGGVEVALSRGWSVKAEYLYVDLGHVKETTHNFLIDNFNRMPEQPFLHNISLRSNIVRLGLNYKFGTP